MSHIQPVKLSQFYRLINHGPTVIVSAQHKGTANAMSVAWACALNFDKLSIVVAKDAYTRGLIEQSGYFAVQVPTAQQAKLVLNMGTQSRHGNPDKMDGVALFYQTGFDNVPLMQGCSAWMICKLIPEARNQEKYDLFIGEVVCALADDRVFKNGHWHFDEAPQELRSLHYIAGGQFYAIGKGINLGHVPE